MKRTTIQLQDQEYYDIKKCGISYSSLIKIGLQTINKERQTNERLSEMNKEIETIKERINREGGRYLLVLEKISKIENEMKK